jgi:transcription elongation factor GreA
MEGNPVYLSNEGLENLNEELHFLKTKERLRIAEAIADARAQGDLSENAEYDAAKEAQGMMEMKIAKLKTILGDSRILDETKVDTSKVGILTKVTVLNKKTNLTVDYTIVSEKEADLKTGKISVKSPIGMGLMGKKIGDVAEVNVPAGIINFEILKISVV